MPPKVILFDIGGVVVISPMSAILSYEAAHDLPRGYINTAISLSGPRGAWAKLETGAIPLDAGFFTHFTSDLNSPSSWARYHAMTSPDSPLPPTTPSIDGEQLFWEMMAAARYPDPNMYPALRRLREHADRRDAGFVLAACSNTVIYPEGHRYNDPDTDEGRFTAEMRALFDVFVSSAHVGHRKPDRGMYEFTLGECERVAREKGVIGRTERLDGKDVVFLDDIGSNLRGARQAGIGKGIKVVIGKTDEAVRELENVTGLRLRDEKGRL